MSMIFSLQTAKSAAPFAGLTEKEKENLLAEGRTFLYQRGQFLFHHGDLVAHFYIVISGAVQLFRQNLDGKEKTIDILKCGDILGENEIMDNCRSYRVNAISIEDTTVIAFPAAWLKESAKKYSAFALNLLSLIAQRAHMMEVEAEHMVSMSAAQLVACFLQRVCVLHDLDPKGFNLPYTKTLIASRLGIELETLSRTLTTLKEHGLSIKGSHVTIHNPLSVAQYVCGFCSIAEACTTHQAMKKTTKK